MNHTHRRWALHVMTWLFMVGVLASSCPAAQGAEPNVAVVVDCPLLRAEGKAAVEARARAELMVNGLDDGMLVVVCTVDGATVRWRPGPGDPVAESGPVVEGVELVEQLVDLVHSVSARALEPPPPAAEPSDGTATDAHATVESKSPAPRLEQPPTSPAEPARQPEAQDDGELEDETKKDCAAEFERMRELRYPDTGFMLLLGMSGKLWRGDIPGAVGYRFGWGLRLSRSWMAAAVVGAHWGVAIADGVSASTDDLAIELDFRLVDGWLSTSGRDGWWLGTGPCARVPYVREGGRNVDGGTRRRPAAGLLLRWRYGIRLGNLRYFAGPGLRLMDHAERVTVEGEEVFRLPWYVATFTVEAQALYR